MAFNIYDPKGYRFPYHPEAQWRKLKAPQEPQPFTETKQEKEEAEEKQKEKGDYFVDILEREKTKKRAPLPSKEKEGVIYAAQIMKRPVICLAPETTLPEAWRLIKQHRFRHIPVVNKEGRLVGILSDRTILNEVAPFNKHHGHKFEDVMVKEIMSVPVLTAHPNTEIADIAKMFINERIGSMPIIDEEHKLVGILTRSDILRTLVKIDLLEFRV